MALTKEDLAAISQLLDTKLKIELQPLKDDISQLKGDMNQLKGNMNQLEGDMNQLKQNQQATHNLLLETRLHIENTTDHNIQLLAENHINLVNKLNEAIPAVSKNLAYDVKVNYLVEKVNGIEKDVAELKSKIA